MSSEILSVAQVCETIWGCQKAEEVVPWLKTLQSALLKDPLDSYDPSEAFLSIQGAALRFRPPQLDNVEGLEREVQQSPGVGNEGETKDDEHSDGTTNQKDKKSINNEKEMEGEPSGAVTAATTAREQEYREFYWTIAEESLWAAASLACASVGPSWRFQLYQRRLWLSLSGKQSRYTRTGSRDERSTSSISKGDTKNNTSNSSYAEKDTMSIGSHPSVAQGGSGGTDDDMSSILRDLNNHSYPPIPEVLPAAMLRFASSFLSLFPDSGSLSSMSPERRGEWIIQQKTIAIAQRYLVLALCCESPNMMNETGQEQREGDDGQRITRHGAGPKSTEWTIPGAHELVGDMLDFWLRAAETPPECGGKGDSNFSGELTVYSMDWWYTLRVARASTDLVSTGWRPLPKTNIGGEVVQCLLHIAEKGFSLLDDYDEDRATTLTEGDPMTQARIQSKEEEKLAASSSAAETISALASLGSRGLIPVTSQQSTARVVCRLHVISGAIRMTASGRHHPDKSDAEHQIFMSQIESCFADTADFLWILFATHTSAANTSKAFLELVKAADYNSHSCALPSYSEKSDNSASWDSKSKLICMEAGTAVRMMSAAAWGRPPDVVGIPHLRNYWLPILDSICNIASSVHGKVREEMVDLIAEERDVGFSTSQSDLLSLALDTVVALGNFVDRELVGGNGVVSVLEWESFLCGLDQAVAPWMDYPRYDTTGNQNEVDQPMPGILERAHLEIESLLLRLGALLDKCVRLESSPFHGVLDYDKQRRLYFFIIEKAIPHMDEMDSELLGLSVIRAWSKFGLYPYRYDGTGLTVSEILRAAFTRYEDGSYIHSARVRLEGLRALTRGESEHHAGGPDDRGALLLATQIDQQEHLGLIDNAIKPALKAILVADDETLPDSWIKPIPRSKQLSFERGENSVKNFGLASTLASENSFPLESFAVRLAGRMIRDFGVDQETESAFVGILRSVALKEERENTEKFEGKQASKLPESATAFYERLQLQGSIRLEAVSELELCLAQPFEKQTKSNHIAPMVLEALMAILRMCSEPTKFTNSSHENAILAVAVLIPLARLKLVESSKIALLPRVEVTKYIPGSLLPLLSLKEKNHHSQTGLPSQVAPFIVVCDHDTDLTTTSTPCQKSNKTFISLGMIISSIVEVLEKVTNSKSQTWEDISHLRGTILCSCLNALRSYLLSGYVIQNSTIVSKIISLAASDREEATSEERLAWVKLQATLLQSVLSNRLCNKNEETSEIPIGDALLEPLLLACDSTQPGESVAACRAIVSILPSLFRLRSRGIGDSLVETLFSQILSSLSDTAIAKPVAAVDIGTTALHQTTSRLTVLNEVMASGTTELPAGCLTDLFDRCVDTISKLLKLPPTNCLYTAIKCVITTIDRLPLEAATRIVNENGDFGFMEMDEVVSLAPAAELDAPRAGFLEFLLSELLVQRIQKLMLDQHNCGGKQSNVPLKSSTHELLAKELDFMERFPVDDGSSFSDSPKAAWLCGECVLLTCRIGSSKSRYRGWVEIVVRCPTTRKRVMVRLLSSISLTNPEATSMLWSQPDSLSDKHLSRPQAAALAKLPDFDTKPSSAVEKAASLMARFDSLIGQPGEEEAGSQLDSSNLETLSLKGDLPERNSIISPSNVSFSSSGLAEQGPQGHDLSIMGWLSRVFDGDKDKINDVKHALRKLNFTEEIIASQGRELDHEPDSTYPSVLTNRLPIRSLQQGPRLDRAISVLDRTMPQNTCKFALLYAGPRRIGRGGADPETMLLEARHCSPAYHAFSNGLGAMVPTRHLRYFSAGLDVSKYQSDGEFTRAWTGHVTSSLPAAMNTAVYHVVNIMPEGINNRKRHVGNDNVLIVFVDKDSPIAIDVSVPDMEQEHPLVSGHFGFATIYVAVIPNPRVLRVAMQLRPGIPADLRNELLPFVSDDIIDATDAAIYVRALAIRVDTACRSILDNLAPASNSHERYRILREMNRHVAKRK